MITKTDFDDKLLNLNKKITLNKTKYVLFENELKKLKTFDSSYFIGKNYFEENGTQNYLALEPISRYFKINGKYTYRGNLQDYLMKLLHLMPTLIIVLLH